MHPTYLLPDYTLAHMDPVPSSIPFHIARAYGLGTRPASQIEAKPSAATSNSASTDRLVAATVGGPITFNSLDTAAPTKTDASEPADSFPLYRHPADKNAAATSINAGRALDTQA